MRRPPRSRMRWPKATSRKMMLCVSVDLLKDLAQQNGMTGAGN